MEIVIGEVAGDIVAGLAAVLVFGHFEFGLDGAEAGFHEGVVVAVGGPAHALAELSSAEDGAISVAGILSAAIAVMDQACGGLPVTDGMLKGIQDERVGHLLGQAPADDASRAEIENQSQKGKAALKEIGRAHV